MRILFLSQRVPYPPNRGDKITTWRLIERMARRHDVTVIAFAHDDADEAALEELRNRGFDAIGFRLRKVGARLRALPLLVTKKPLTLGFYGSRALQEEVDRRIEWADVAYAYSSSMGAFLVSHPETPRVMHFAELDSDKWRQYSERTGPPGQWIYRREWRTLLGFERKLAHASFLNVLCTIVEERIFREQIPGAPTAVLTNGVDLAAFAPSPETRVPGRIVFTGVMNYLPNIDGCVFFANLVFPEVLKEFPDATFIIVGADPTPEIERLTRIPNVIVTGTVPDTRDFLREAAVAVAPLRIARGIQNKVLEAMAMGLPVVGSTAATKGVGGEPGRHFLVGDESESQIRAVCSLLGDDEHAQKLGASARSFVEENYDWETCLAPLDGILERCKASRAAS